ncbi:MAG: succinate dehydrogenase/fumarate reductase flavoprotein subunit [Sulfurimonas sp.]|jgi:succinate dehydrogenase/fumarate reductase flavoprotein subunit
MRSDVLIIGAGGAGLVAAINAHESGAKVVVITKEYPTRSQTCMAQGGINAALGNMGEDSVEAHVKNTLKSAHSIANEEAVRHLCQSAPDAITWLDSIGVCFSRTKDAKIAQRTLGGASAPRACYAQDYTGLKILHTLYDRCLSLGIEILNEKFLLDYLVEDNFACGAVVLDIRTGEVQTYESASVIIATGGYSGIYDKHSTNSSATTGDGLAAAIRAGARVSDMEFVQFHPTALKSSSVLISESARGAGGFLLNSKGERFVNELLPRDEVARAIDTEMKKSEDIFLDIRHLGEEFINKELPQERKLAKLYENLDPVYDLIPVKPVAHYTMGGIEVDNKSSTIVKGLYAVGECANHRVHGANRLGGNSLLELVVFGEQAGKNAALYSKSFDKKIDSSKQLKRDKDFLSKIKSFSNEIDFYKIREELGDMFYKNVGISRCKNTLEASLKKVECLLSEIHLMGVSDKSKVYNTNLTEFLEFENMLELSKLVLQGAITRDESRGSHFREDFPQENEKFKMHTIVDRNGVVS